MQVLELALPVLAALALSRQELPLPADVLRLHYRQRSAPEEALRLGNGRLEARCFGVARQPRWSLAHHGIERIEAGVVEIDFTEGGATLDEEHQLLFDQGVVTATFSDGDHRFLCDSFVSHADPLLVIRLRKEGGPFSLRIGWRDAERSPAVVAGNDRLVMERASHHGALQIKSVGGVLASDGTTLTATGVYALVVHCTVEPNDLAGTGARAIDATLAAASALPFDDLIARHEEARELLLGDFALELGEVSDLQRRRLAATDQRLRVVASGAEDPDLVAAWFLMARHRLACSGPLPDERRAAASLLATPSRWPTALKPTESSTPPRAEDLQRVDAARARLDGDAAWAALSPRLAKQTASNLEFEGLDPMRGQLDAAAAIASFLLDEQGETLALLPTLPRTWSDGFLRSFRTASGVVVDLRWSNGALDAARFRVEASRMLRLRLPAGEFEFHAMGDDGEPGATLPAERPAPRQIAIEALPTRPLLLLPRR